MYHTDHTRTMPWQHHAPWLNTTYRCTEWTRCLQSRQDNDNGSRVQCSDRRRWRRTPDHHNDTRPRLHADNTLGLTLTLTHARPSQRHSSTSTRRQHSRVNISGHCVTLQETLKARRHQDLRYYFFASRAILCSWNISQQCYSLQQGESGGRTEYTGYSRPLAMASSSL